MTDRKDELTVLEAFQCVTEFISDPKPCSGRSSLHMWFWRHDLVLEMLRDGTWYATGYRTPFGPSSKKERLAAHLWDVLGLDAAKESARGAELEYVGIRIHKDGALPESPPVPDETGSVLKKSTDGAYAARVEQFLKEEGRKPKRAEDEEWGRNNGLPRERIRTLRSSTRTPEEIKGGAPKKKTRRKN